MAVERWAVHKFGGTSLATADCYQHCADLTLAAERDSPVMVVVSAQGRVQENGSVVHDKVTSELIRCSVLASSRDDGYKDVLHAIVARQRQLAMDCLVEGTTRHHLIAAIDNDHDDLLHVLHCVFLERRRASCPWWSGYGELWSARLLTALLQQRITSGGDAVDCIDGRSLIIIDGNQVPILASSRRLWKEYIRSRPAQRVVVLTGFICSDEEGRPSTLGRDGSDHSASIISATISASSLTIWSDVDGVYTADPNTVPNAIVRSYMSYHEAMELAYFGAKVLHPKTMTPLIGGDIPICIRNTFRPHLPGTRISSAPSTPSGDKTTIIKGFSSITDLMLINVEGSGMIGVPGIARRLFSALHLASCSVVLITQAGSEHSICLAIPRPQSAAALDAVAKEFRDELASGDIATVDSFGPCACLAAVGDNMRHAIGIAGKLMSALARADVNIRAIAQGASERNISIVIDQADVDRALKAVHREMIETPSGKVAVGLIGSNTALGNLMKKSIVPLIAPALCDGDTSSLFQVVNELKLASRRILVDCSDDDTIARQYAALLAEDVTIISSNSALAMISVKDGSFLREQSGFSFHNLGAIGGVPVLPTLHRIINITRVILAFPDEKASSITAHVAVIISRAIGAHIDIDDVVVESPDVRDKSGLICAIDVVSNATERYARVGFMAQETYLLPDAYDMQLIVFTRDQGYQRPKVVLRGAPETLQEQSDAILTQINHIRTRTNI